jgi:hypothetical protein
VRARVRACFALFQHLANSQIITKLDMNEHYAVGNNKKAGT